MTDTVITTTVEVATNAGHEALDLTRDQTMALVEERGDAWVCLLYTSPSPRDRSLSRMPSSA